jgi:hypothetical protein
MRSHSAVLALLLLCSATAFADSIDRVSPQSFFAGNPEVFLSIFGTGLAGTESTVVVYTGDAGQFSVDASDASSTRLDVWVPIPVTSNAGRYAIDVYATDLAGTRHIGPAFIDVVQQIIEAPPLLGIPEVIITEATSPSGAVVNFDATGQSQGGTGLTVTCDHTSGATYSVGTTTVHCTATDSFGSTSGSFLIVVQDTGLPTLTLPANINSADPVVTYTVSATDAIDGDVPVHCSPASGSTFPTGVTVVQCSATDSNANTAFGTFRVTIGGALPELVLPDDILVEATSPSGTPVNYTVTATENGVVSCSPASGSSFPLGTTPVNCTATNTVGSVTGTFNVTVIDTTPPEIVKLTANPGSLWPPNHKMVSVTVSAIVVDNGDASPQVHIISVSSNQPINGTGDGDTAPDWNITGAMTVDLRAERAGNSSTERKYTITVEAVDASGNASQSTVVVTVAQSKGRAVR